MFKDFSMYVGTNPDPVDSYVAHSPVVSSGHVGAAWGRPYVLYVPSKNTKYVSVGMLVDTPATATAGSEHLASQYFDKWLLERVVVGQATPTATYSKAREVQVIVRPDRINLVTNPSFEIATTNWIGNACTITRVTTQAAVGTASLSLTATSAGTIRADTLDGAPRFPVTPEETYTVQAQFKAATVARSVRVSIGWYNSGGALISTTDGTTVANTTSGWTQATLTAEAPTTAVTCRVFCSVLAAANGEVHYLDAVLLEKGSTVLPFFDGSSGDNYLWESGGTPNQVRSYYYENRLERTDAMLRAIQDAVPLGVGIGTPQFAVWTG